MKQRIRSDIIDLRLKAKRAGAYPCEVGCPFGGDCEICCYLFPALFANCAELFQYRFLGYGVSIISGPAFSEIEPDCPCFSLGEHFVSRRIALFMEERWLNA